MFVAQVHSRHYGYDCILLDVGPKVKPSHSGLHTHAPIYAHARTHVRTDTRQNDAPILDRLYIGRFSWTADNSIAHLCTWTNDNSSLAPFQTQCYCSSLAWLAYLQIKYCCSFTNPLCDRWAYTGHVCLVLQIKQSHNSSGKFQIPSYHYGVAVSISAIRDVTSRMSTHSNSRRL